MEFKEHIAAVLFEPYGALLEIETDERDWYAYLNLARFLEYRGVSLTADALRWLWFETLARQVRESGEPYPEVDARAAWREILSSHRDPCRQQPDLDHGTFLADVTTLHRALTRRTLRLMEGVRPLLEGLHGRLRLGVVTDAQPDYILPELEITDIRRLFDVIVISGERGYRKPDARLFHEALTTLDVPPHRALFVGVDTGRDIAGARAAGMHTALVLTPYGSKDIALGEPELVLDRTADLADVLEATPAGEGAERREAGEDRAD